MALLWMQEYKSTTISSCKSRQKSCFDYEEGRSCVNAFLIILVCLIFVALIVASVAKANKSRLNAKMEEFYQLTSQGIDPREAKNRVMVSLKKDFQQSSYSDSGMRAYHSLKSSECQSCGATPALFQDRNGIWCRKCACTRLCGDERALADTILGVLLHSAE